MSNQVSPLVQRRDRSWRDFAAGAVGAAIVLLLGCGVLAPRSAELAALGQTVIGIGLAVAAVGAVLCAARTTRAVGAGVVTGVVVGVAVAWSALIAYVGLLMR
ncbi:hypothetical protein GCM10009844_44540 [Nocardioides koreensis]|uniref:DUF4190 domain-containing protein n=1 Tax=Nocardioides koreensis TaxID=433651 RepID=A0ABN3A9E7_9ACTN